MNDEAINQLHGIEKLLVALIEAGHINLIELGLGVGGSADVVTGFAVGVNFVDEGFCYMGVHGGERVGGEGMGECWVWGRGVWLFCYMKDWWMVMIIMIIMIMIIREKDVF